MLLLTCNLLHYKQLMNQNIGQKIKTYRVRKGMTQLELENKLNLANGSLTKIESGKVMPGRETIVKIIDTLNLSPHESAMLLGLSVSKIAEVIDVISNIMILEDEMEISQAAVNEIPKKLGLLGASFNLVFGDSLKTTAITQSWYTEILLKVMPFKPTDYSVSLTKDKHNLMIKTINENKSYYGEDLHEFTHPYIAPTIARMLQKTASVKSMLSVPMVVENEKVGVIIYAKDQKMDFLDEIPLLNSYTNAIALLIHKSRKNKSIH